MAADTFLIQLSTTVENVNVNVALVSAESTVIEYSYPQGPPGPQGIPGTGTGIGTFEVSKINNNNIFNVLTGISALRFDDNSGFDVTDLSSGAVKIGLNSTFKFWEVIFLGLPRPFLGCLF